MDRAPGRHRSRRPGAEVEATLEELLLGQPATMGPGEISAASGVSRRAARKFWHALGFPIVQNEDRIFTEADQLALQRVAAMVRTGEIDQDVALAMTRAFARTADRLAVWQTQLMAEAIAPDERDADLSEKDGRAVTDVSVAEAAARQLTALADDLEPLLVYAWRRHLAAAITRMSADIALPEQSAGSPVRAVGFADLVNFTSLVRRMSERQLATLVQRFETLAHDVVVAHGGRVIKTVGDEILFVHQEPAAAAAIGLDLVAAMTEDPLLPDLRVGLALGPVVSRMGDIFGTTVNRASRLTSVTPPSSVYVDDAYAKALGATSGFDMAPQRRRNLRGIGSVLPHAISRASHVRRT